MPSCVGHPRIGIFDRLADRNAAAIRTIEGQNTRLNRTVHGVAYDAIHDEIVVNQFIGQAVLTFRGAASGAEAPIRTIMGPKTQMIDPISVAVDPVNDEIYVFQITNSDRVLVFDRTAQGDVAPKRVLMQPAGSGGVDPINNVLVLINRNSIRIFDRLAQGNDKPLRVITGPRTGLNGVSRITMYPPGGKIVVNVTGPGRRGRRRQRRAGLRRVRRRVECLRRGRRAAAVDDREGYPETGARHHARSEEQDGDAQR